MPASRCNCGVQRDKRTAALQELEFLGSDLIAALRHQGMSILQGRGMASLSLFIGRIGHLRNIYVSFSFSRAEFQQLHFAIDVNGEGDIPVTKTGSIHHALQKTDTRSVPLPGF